MAHKNSHLIYYIKSFLMLLSPPCYLHWREKRMLADYSQRADRDSIDRRVDYYNCLQEVAPLTRECRPLACHTYRKRKGGSVYFFDTYEFTRYFPKRFLWNYEPGDVTCLFDSPTVTKTRPLLRDDARFPNSVVLNLDKVRHFLFVDDPIPFERKRKIVLFRGDAVGKPQRVKFLQTFKGKAGFNVGDTSGKLDASLQGDKLSIDEHFKYRYIMALEGNDVASNLKWVMSSNCIAVMPRPTCESWFMEGTLRPGYHYIEIRPDFSDLEERIAYYNEHIEEARAIIAHAHEYVSQFMDAKRERLIAYLVMRKYFEKTSVGGKVQLD